jgi:flagellar hook-length control protein FliK
VQVQLHGGRIHLQMSSNDPAAREALQEALPQLQSELEDSGFEQASYQLGGNDRGDGDRGRRGGDRQGGRGDRLGAPTAPAQRPSGRNTSNDGGLDLHM